MFSYNLGIRKSRKVKQYPHHLQNSGYFPIILLIKYKFYKGNTFLKSYTTESFTFGNASKDTLTFDHSEHYNKKKRFYKYCKYCKLFFANYFINIANFWVLVDHHPSSVMTFVSRIIEPSLLGEKLIIIFRSPQPTPCHWGGRKVDKNLKTALFF